MAAGDAEVNEHLRDGFGGHRGAAVSLQAELAGCYALAGKGAGKGAGEERVRELPRLGRATVKPTTKRLKTSMITNSS